MGDIVALLRKQHDLPIVYDQAELDKIDVNDDILITIKFRKISLELFHFRCSGSRSA